MSAFPDLGQFIGTEQWYRHGLMRGIVYTDGAKYVADQAQAYWLLDEIATSQLLPALRKEAFQVWKLAVHPDLTAAITVEDGNDNVIYSKELNYTTFPEDGITLWFTDNTILLPGEY